ncbi:MAG: tRNA uridine-5-carboxymethylaminomethyl(34) synthesis GTPase MnmE [Methyloversatilis sp.]|jgi:tRNA modification GTPase|nr:tRNA uridine-5-carboxymethylaminomethyl(34) synthesis GTPase MnmE [Methyloversatilis sp.]MBP6193433.1 tRNA uridine-5-carboxymethylaminomethyl(34) synthesis GTPase MnmE [Methyloversatilis sp.]MBP9118066.1 tRNA uridine-5-carboxymethylaminomethyl(34) synthesis GTPase MnmE [Methyloversatilis sp.]
MHASTTSRSGRPRPPADTIAAIATAPGRGGIGVIRISGRHAGDVARGVLGRIPEARHAAFLKFLSADGSTLDHGIALWFEAPASYTGEHVLELHGHGGTAVLQALLARCLELGARPARPGEFTERAFLNDRMDLAQAEAVADLIDASTTAAALSAMRSLDGEFSRHVHRLEQTLVDLRMFVEATLDFPEEDVEFIEQAGARNKLNEVMHAVGALRARARCGVVLREGMTVVLAGAPNVGKSSLLNALAGEDRAIVTDIAGTTRDTLRELIAIDDVPLHVIDTAGLRDTDDPVEQAGIARTRRELERAHAVVQLIDARSGFDHGAQAIDAALPPGLRRVRVFNKIDLTGEQARTETRDGVVSVWLSVLSGEGLDLLQRTLLDCIAWHGGAEDALSARSRHLYALDSAVGHLEAARASIAGKTLRLDLLAEELRLAHRALGDITGEFTADDLLGEIFSRFCIGK